MAPAAAAAARGGALRLAFHQAAGSTLLKRNGTRVGRPCEVEQLAGAAGVRLGSSGGPEAPFSGGENVERRYLALVGSSLRR